MGVAIVLLVVYLGIIVLMIASLWKIFTKAGKPGWASIIPIYNYVIMLEIGGKPIWWLAIILLVPIVNIIFLIMMLHGVSKAFGKDGGYTAGMIFLPFVFLPMLAFGSAQYVGAAQKTTAA